MPKGFWFWLPGYATIDEMNSKLDLMRRDLGVIKQSLVVIMRVLGSSASDKLSPEHQAMVNEIVAIEVADKAKIDAALSDK
jgi:hypothetical protein